MPFLLPRSLVCTAPSTQGHVEAAALFGGIYYWGQGVAVDYKRAMAANKIGAEGGDAVSQFQLGGMLSKEASLELLLRTGGCEDLLDDPPAAALEVEAEARKKEFE